MTPPDRHTNHLGQPVGFPVPGWTPRERPPRTPMSGRFCDLEPIDVQRHATDLYAAYALDRDGRNWTYFSYGPFEHADNYRQWLSDNAALEDPLLHAIVDKETRQAVGVAAFMRIDPPNGVMEVGHIHYSPRLQRTPGVEVRQPERGLAPRGRAIRFHLRGHLPPGHRLQSPKPRHGMVFLAR